MAKERPPKELHGEAYYRDVERRAEAVRRDLDKVRTGIDEAMGRGRPEPISAAGVEIRPKTSVDPAPKARGHHMSPLPAGRPSQSPVMASSPAQQNDGSSPLEGTDTVVVPGIRGPLEEAARAAQELTWEKGKRHYAGHEPDGTWGVRTRESKKGPGSDLPPL